MVRTRTFGRNGHNMWFDSLGVKGQRQCVNTEWSMYNIICNYNYRRVET